MTNACIHPYVANTDSNIFTPSSYKKRNKKEKIAIVGLITT